MNETSILIIIMYIIFIHSIGKITKLLSHNLFIDNK
jgi:hypothetical protein